MGAFNIVTFDWKEPNGSVRSLRAQFKYGNTWQEEYRVGDMVRWGGNDIGDRFARRVVVHAPLNASSETGDVPSDFEVHIVDGKIEKVLADSGSFDFVAAQQYFIVLER